MSVPLYTRNESFVYAHPLQNQECKRSDRPTHRFIVEMLFTLLMVTITHVRSIFTLRHYDQTIFITQSPVFILGLYIRE